eukprot:6057562-Lingulodinium_polyedra.AAC.1
MLHIQYRACQHSPASHLNLRYEAYGAKSGTNGASRRHGGRASSTPANRFLKNSTSRCSFRLL